MNRARHVLLACLAGFISLALTVLAGELYLRAFGYTPIKSANPSASDYDQKAYKSDPVKGWVHVPGTFEWEGAKATFLEDSSRVTGNKRGSRLDRVVILVGGSFTEGGGVDDEDTFAWRLQERFPDLAVLNFGTSGYGTLQSLLMMEEQFGRLRDRPKPIVPEITIYGFIPDHLQRNVNTYQWRRANSESSLDSRQQPARSPYAVIDPEGQLQIFSPEPWPLTTLARRFALAAFLTDRYVDYSTRARSKQMEEVCIALLVEMNRLAEENGSKFAVAVLSDIPVFERYLGPDLTRRAVPYFNCPLPRPRGPFIIDLSTSHPIPAQHAQYADCIGSYLEKAIQGRLSGAP